MCWLKISFACMIYTKAYIQISKCHSDLDDAVAFISMYDSIRF